MESGRLPELFVLPNEETRRNYVGAIKDTVLLRDIIQGHSVKDLRLLEDLFVYLVNNEGIEQGRHEEALKIACEMKKDQFPIEQISKLTKLPIEEIEALVLDLGIL